MNLNEVQFSADIQSHCILTTTDLCVLSRAVPNSWCYFLANYSTDYSACCIIFPNRIQIRYLVQL